MKVRHASLLTACATLVAGFGSLTFLWLQEGRPLIAANGGFRAATLGDAVLLPIVTGTLAHCALSLPSGRLDRVLTVAAGAVGGLTGVVVQAAVLADPDPARQWLLTSPHNFSIAGWWHAGFFAATSSIIAALWVLTLSRIRRNQGTLLAHHVAGQQRGEASWLAFAAAGFLALNLLDSASNPQHESTRAILLAIAIAIALAAAPLLLAVPQWTRATARAIISGLIMSGLLALVCQEWPPKASGVVGISLVFAAHELVTRTLARRKWAASS